MSKPKQSFLTAALKAYVQMKSAKAGLVPRPLESERKLEIRFGISRPTVHQALEELVADGWCLKLPGKRHLYTNPERFNPKIRNIGLLSGDLSSNSFICLTSLSGFISELSDNRTFVHFPRLSSQNSEDVIQELKNMEFDGLMICFGHQEKSAFLPDFIKRFIADGFPIVVMTSQFVSDKFKLPEDYYEPYDYEAVARDRAKFVRSHGYRRVMLVSRSCDPVIFNRYSGNLLDPALHIKTVCDIPKRLPKLLARHQPDLIIVDGDFNRYITFFQTLDKCPGKIPDLMVYPLAIIYCPDIEQKYRILYIDENKSEWDRGVSAARKLIAQIDRKENSAC